MNTRRAGIVDYLLTIVLAIAFVVLVHVALERNWFAWPGAR